MRPGMVNKLFHFFLIVFEKIDRIVYGETGSKITIEFWIDYSMDKDRDTRSAKEKKTHLEEEAENNEQSQKQFCFFGKNIFCFL